MRRLRHPSLGVWACLCALAVTLGAHWHVAQSIAWARMIVAYSRTNSFGEAWGKTFDGKHPCALCLKVRAGRQQEHEQQKKFPLPKSELNQDLLGQTNAAVVPSPPADWTEAIGFVPSILGDITHRPPIPPPRA